MIYKKLIQARGNTKDFTKTLNYVRKEEMGNNRLSKRYNKYGKPYCFNCKEEVRYDNDIVRQTLYKLGKLEDLEEQIGCPLDVLFKAMTSKIYYDIASGTGTINRPLLWFDDDGMFVFDTLGDADYIYLNDYKQTWWLKEDRSE